VLITNHVLSGALIGAVARTPARALALGVVSHFVLDAVPHWGDWGSQQRFLKVAIVDGLAGLAVMSTATAMTPPDRRAAVLAGMAGAAIPDLDKPARLWFGRSPWPGAIDRFHSAIQDEASDRFGREMKFMAVFAAAVTLTAKRSGKRARPGRLYRRS
jgi:hypothetical protein